MTRLMRDVTRCDGHNPTSDFTCPYRDTCERYLQRSEDPRAWTTDFYCLDDWSGLIERKET